VVLECATGRKPWSSNLDNEWAIIYQIGQADRAPQLPDPSQLSDLGISFIKQCLTLDPMKRPTAEALLNHPWMQSFRAEMQDYEEGSDAFGRPPSPDGSSQLEPTAITRQAQLEEEQELEEMMMTPEVERDLNG